MPAASESTASDASRRWLPALLACAALIAIFAAARHAGVTPLRALTWVQSWARQSPWLLLALCAIRPPFLLPITGLVALSGSLWGFWKGGAYALAGMLLSAAVGYAIGRLIVPARQTTPAPHSRHGRWLERLRRDGFGAVMMMRLMLLPFDAVNIAAAAVRVNFRSYLLATLSGNLPATALWVSLGASIRLDELLAGGTWSALGHALDLSRLLPTLALFGAALLLARWTRNRSRLATAP